MNSKQSGGIKRPRPVSNGAKDHILINGVSYISARKAAREFGYTPDYVGQLVRNSKVKGHTFSRTLYISEKSLVVYAEKAKEEKGVRAKERKTEFKAGRKVPIKIVRK